MEKTASVQLGEFTLTLAPLKREQVRAAHDLVERLIASVGKPVTPAWVNDVEQALRLVYGAAREPRPPYAAIAMQLTLSAGSIADQGTLGELNQALNVLAALTLAAYVPKN